MTDITKFQYCQKIFVMNESNSTALLARRAGEADYDGAYSLIGGKMEHSDGDILTGLAREKNEEIGSDAIIEVILNYSYNTTFEKKDGSFMILPHYYARYAGGEIILNEEYSDFTWVPLAKLPTFEPLIANVPEIGTILSKLVEIATPEDYVRLPS
ncbi:NUDIX hydrolase [Nocardia sp. NPDC056000]|uniref:NUDIX hydrolase n=1 Tax=Nocardia sp. NPDC056000 TaxID=3345674 RepID=UPI0035DAAB58